MKEIVTLSPDVHPITELPYSPRTLPDPDSHRAPSVHYSRMTYTYH